MTMPSLANTPVLVLNASYEPIQIANVKRAVKLVVKDAAEIEAHKGREIYPGIFLPTVVRLKRHKHIPHRVQVMSRKNIYLRDKYVCQYCYKKFPPSELTLDHILPQSKGGRSTWENLATCCRSDNLSKADRTPEEAGMVLLKRYRPLNIHTSRHVLRSIGENNESWRKYLFFENLTSQED
jgi:5-methylcytosine-specific restriction endonuclease McrA